MSSSEIINFPKDGYLIAPELKMQVNANRERKAKKPNVLTIGIV
jgi:hypothetical protein